MHRLKALQGEATHSMQLAKNNNPIWRVISNGDQPLPHLLRRPDLNKYQESQFKTEKAAVTPKNSLSFVSVIFLKLSDLKRPWPMKLLINNLWNKERKACHFPGFWYVYVEKHLSNNAVLIAPSLIVCSPVKSSLANPKEPWSYFPRQNAAVSICLFSH